jgi:mgtE-like transporter
MSRNPRVLRPRPFSRMGGWLWPDATAARQSLAALGVGLLASFVAGLVLGSITGTLESLPGLLVLIPAAIGMRGTIFGALGSRLSTSIHTGTFGLRRRADTVVGQNVLASVALTFSTAAALAFLAKAVGAAFGLQTISITSYLVISIVGGVLASTLVLLLTLGLAAAGARKGWDLDNVMAPIVTAAGDMATLPALWLATHLVGIDVVTPLIGVTLGIVSAVVLAAAVASGLHLLRRILAESLPIVLAGGTVQLLAGLTIEQRLEAFTEWPSLLVLVPPFLASAGALGGILSSRLSSKLHLGLITPQPFPSRQARNDIALTFALALPVFIAASVVADVGAAVGGLATPGPLRMVVVSLLAGLLTSCFVVVVAYYGAVAALRFGLDPDNYGIPLVTASVDMVGALALIFAIVAVGLA